MYCYSLFYFGQNKVFKRGVNMHVEMNAVPECFNGITFSKSKRNRVYT